MLQLGISLLFLFATAIHEASRDVAEFAAICLLIFKLLSNGVVQVSSFFFVLLRREEGGKEKVFPPFCVWLDQEEIGSGMAEIEGRV